MLQFVVLGPLGLSSVVQKISLSDPKKVLYILNSGNCSAVLFTSVHSDCSNYVLSPFINLVSDLVAGPFYHNWMHDKYLTLFL